MPKTILIDGQPMGTIPTIPASRTIAEAAANQTYAAQLTYLKTYYDALSDEEKARARIVIGTTAFINTGTGLFMNIIGASNGIWVHSMRTDNSTYTEGYIKTNNTVEYANYSSLTDASPMKLIVV